ncbi:copper resistance protein CopD [Nocardioides sp. GY 10113]|uniref:cytochrome c oxidase assembly protein n=1 Tax=Nocardioides sp. GY 10113 TaxID=2569761 RepID=UPI0010A85BC2|nr:cytochrome c oxidase assembly protein [Nocardioides sp. GY 10113]TIC86780.1 copper resistance protein CopD [Nocardioides sp. GY 10113]
MSAPAPQRPATTGERPGPADRRRPVLAAAAVLAGLAALVTLLLVGGGAPREPIPGLPDPGRLTGWGLPIVRLLTDLLAVGLVAGLMVAPLTMRRPADEMSGRALRATGSVRWLAAGWALAALAQLVLTFSDQFAIPLGDVTWVELRGFARTVDQGQALVVQALLAAAVAVVARWMLTNRSVLILLGVALVGLVPPLLTGHAASSGSHDTAIVAIVIHVLAAVVWSGGVLALWWHLGSAEEPRLRAVRRFGAVATWCFGLVLASGLLSAWVRVASVDELLSAYALGALAKVAVVGLIGVLVIRYRRRLPDAGLSARALLARLTAVEGGLMAIAMGLGVALSRTPPPVGEPYTSAAESLLGGPIPPEPTLGRLLWSFTPSGLGLAVVGIGTAAYLVGLVTLRRRGDSWPVLRTVSWFLGIALVGYATLGGLGVYANVMFSAHMAAHMMLSMVAPILLVLGQPIQLALRALPGSDVPGGVGPRQMLATALGSRIARLWLNPVTAGLLLVGALYPVYLTGLFDGLMQNHLGHLMMEAHFLVAGLIFFELLLGSRPGHQVSYISRLMLLLVTMPFHAFFSITVMGSDTVVGERYYSLLDLPYVPDLLADQNLAGSMNWALGEVPMVMVIVVLVIQWFRDDTREAKRRDRAADRDGDAELAAYNRMLQGIGDEVKRHP